MTTAQKKNFLKLGDLHSYQLSTALSHKIWNIVAGWKPFEKNTIGIQWIRSSDSIGANIAEGFGRFHKKDKQKFYFNARASVFESAHWAKTAMQRELLPVSDFDRVMKILRPLPKEINHLISFTEQKLTI